MIRIPNPVPRSLKAILAALDVDDKLHEESNERLYRIEAILVEIIVSQGYEPLMKAAKQIIHEHDEAMRLGKV